VFNWSTIDTDKKWNLEVVPNVALLSDVVV